MSLIDRINLKLSGHKTHKTPLVGIDLSGRYGLLIELGHTTAGFSLERMALQQIEVGTFNNEILSNAESLTDTLNKMRENAHIKGADSVIAAPADSAVSKIFNLDNSLPNSNQEALALQEAKKVFTESSSDLMIDFCSLKEENSQNTLLVTGRKSHIMPRVEAITKACLTPIVVDTDYLALQRSIELIKEDIPKSWESQPTAIAHISPCYILFIIIDDERVVFQHHEHYRGEGLEKIITSMVTKSSDPASKEQKIAAIHHAGLQIKRQWQYYQAQPQHKALPGFIISGSLGCLAETKNTLTELLNTEVVIADPISKLKLGCNIDSDQAKLISPATLLACGLAMRKKTMKVRINLLPWRNNVQKKQRQDFFTLLFMAALIGAFICGGWAWFASNQTKHQLNDINHLQAQLTLLTKKIAKLHKIDVRASESKKQLKKFNQLLESRYTLVHLFNTISTAVPQGITLSSIEKTSDVVSIQGVSKQISAINATINHLKHSPLLSQVKLKEIKILSNRDNAFTITATVSTQRDSE
jgi:type IV pilus assembly protein PilM